MLNEVNLLARLPRSRRNVNARAEAKSPEVIRISKQFGQEYFDGPREYGYGGYRYDGRWVPVAEDIVAHFGLKPGDRVLDVGCAKGFLVKDLMKVCPGLDVYGIDISEYAVTHCEPEVIGRLHVGSADRLPFPDGSFDCVLSINTIHNFDRDGVIRACREVQRVRKDNDRAFVQVDSYRDEEQRQLFLDWVLTAAFHDYPDKWVGLFKEAGYTGDYYWTIVE
jgi:Methylase involved in ubiquinone/menaquinone biosynthesis